MKRKVLSILLAASMVAGLLVGCGNSNAGSSDKTDKTENTAETTEAPETSGGEVTLKMGIHVADPASQETVTYNIVQAFNEKYAGKYKVEFEAADTETHSTNLKLEASDGTLPEVFWLDSSEAPEYAEAGYLLDLSDFLEEYKDTDAALDASVKEAFKSDIQYGLPYQCNVEGFFYNKEIFEQLGIAEPANGTTFTQLLDMITKCNEGGITPIAQGCMNSSYAIWGYLAMLDRYGYSEYIQNILAGDKKFNNEDLLKCFEKLQQLGQSGAFSTNMATQEYFDAKELFTSGQAAIFNTGAWDCAELDEKLGDKVGFWWGPTFDDSTYEQKAAMKVPSAPISVSAAVAEDAAKQEGVYKFLEFYYSEDAAKISYEGSVFPATNYTGISAGETQYALGQVMASIDEGWTSPAAQPDQILNSAVQAQLYDSMLGVLLGNYEPADALDKIDQQMTY
ncbi:MAG: extracellular solute-binding protein [Lachnospiraceae bacterium]|nr:extracellular solute-binding protein [Lachnospiraceae bacterium]